MSEFGCYFTLKISSCIEMFGNRKKKKKKCWERPYNQCVCVSWPVCAQCHWPFGFRDHLAQESHFTGGYWGLEE